MESLLRWWPQRESSPLEHVVCLNMCRCLVASHTSPSRFQTWSVVCHVVSHSVGDCCCILHIGYAVWCRRGFKYNAIVYELTCSNVTSDTILLQGFPISYIFWRIDGTECPCITFGLNNPFGKTFHMEQCFDYDPLKGPHAGLFPVLGTTVVCICL